MPKVVKYGRWEEETMERALSSVRNVDMGLNAACRTYSVPKTTLERHLVGKNYYVVEGKKSHRKLEQFTTKIKRGN
jgi:hypothetical protein